LQNFSSPEKKLETINLPYTIRLYGVSEAMFDELVDEDTRAELLDGVVLVHLPATIEHDEISGFIRGLMSFYADARGLGKVLGPDLLVRLRAGRRCAPAVFFVRQDRMPILLPKEFEGAPDLVIEVLLPSNRSDDFYDKRPFYQAAGVDELWRADLELQQVRMDRRQEDGYTDEIVAQGRASSMAMAGFWVNTDWLWADLQEILKGMTPLSDLISPFDSAGNARDVIFYEERVHYRNGYRAQQRSGHEGTPEENIALDQFTHDTNRNGFL
jgi:Uma2 family endonuclease